MDDVVAVEVLQTKQNGADEELHNIFRESVAPAQLKTQVSSGHVVHDEVEV